MAETNGNLHLTSGRLLARNTVWNLLGQAVPMAVGLITIPAIIRGIGVDRFGVLSLVWVVIGYFSLFDLGIGRALTKFVADKLGANEEHSIPALACTSLSLMFALGSVAAVVIFVSSPLLVDRMLKVPTDLQSETLRTFYLLALTTPIVTITAGLRGILDALQSFRIANLIRIPMSIFSFVAPLLVLPFSHSLVAVVSVLVVSRFIGCGVHLWACLRVFPALFQKFSLDRSAILPLAKFGGWITVNNVIGPLMFYVDRFLVGALLSVSAIAYYTAPVDMVLRLAMIPGALVGVLFPAFATSFNQDPVRCGVLLARGLKYIYLIIFPIVLIIVTFAPEALKLWLGPSFSAQGTIVLRLAAAGVFINSLSTLPFGLIQGVGRPDITAYMLAAEFPVYAAVLWTFTRWLGIEGTAVAWTGRLAAEAIVVFFLSDWLLPRTPRLLFKQSLFIGCGLAVLYVASIPKEIGTKLFFISFVFLTFALMIWRWGLTPGEREFVVSLSGRLLPAHPS